MTRERVVAEWLFYVPNKRESKLFERNRDVFELSGVFQEGKGLEDKTRTNALFLSVVAQFNGPIATNILAWFQNMNIISGLQDTGYLGYTMHCLDECEHREEITTLIQKLDLSIDDVQVETSSIDLDKLPEDMPDKLKKRLKGIQEAKKIDIATFHTKYDNEDKPASHVKFDFEEQDSSHRCSVPAKNRLFPSINSGNGLIKKESEGTQKIIALSGPLIDTLKNGRILIIDEFDVRLHPLINREIVKLFHSPGTNPHNAQLIVMSHDTNLLQRELFRRDQIWFTEKGRRGISRLYPLVRYKVRNDAVFEKDYIRGKYGAIPFIGNLEEIFTNDSEEIVV